MIHNTKKTVRFSIHHVLVIAAVLRIGFPVFAGIWNGSLEFFADRDTIEYLLPAQELVNYGTFTIDKVPHIVRTPGYPLLLIPGIVAGHVEIITILLQILMGILTCYVVYRLTMRIASRRAALIAATLLAVDPLSIYYTAELSSETFFTSLFVGALWFFATYLKNSKFRHLLLGTVLCIAAIYVRPVALFLPICIGIFLIVRALFLKQQSRILLLHSTLFILICFLAIAAWVARNHTQAGYSRFSAIEDINLYYYQAASVIAATESRPYLAVQDSLGYNRELVEISHPVSDGNLSEKYLAIRLKALDVIAAHPIRFAQIYASGILRIFIDPGASTYLRMLNLEKNIAVLIGQALDKGIVQALGIFYREFPLVFWSNCVLACICAVFYLFALCGISGAAKISDRWIVLLLAMCALYFIGISGGAAAVSRFRHPIMPIICIAAGYGVVRLMELLKRKRFLER